MQPQFLFFMDFFIYHIKIRNKARRECKKLEIFWERKTFDGKSRVLIKKGALAENNIESNMKRTARNPTESALEVLINSG